MLETYLQGNIKPIFWHKPEYIILHVVTNDALNLPPNEILDQMLELKIKIEEINKDYKVIISINMLISLNLPIVNNKNISRKHLGYTDLHLNSYGFSGLAINLIFVVKKLCNDASYPTDSLKYKYPEAKITNPNTNTYSCL